ncbi:MAG: gfo/Idh/MocA family oxidoreductase [Verrucomicrobia bacterium]|nr:gfo/Idh/MocA family oxidoreductase [Verrucomicrobiota bacterium]
MGDVFKTQMENSQESLKKQFEKDPTRVNVTESRQFTGLDAYQKVLQSGVDVVLLTTPGGFRPFHLRAAIEAGKHVFCEKPMGVDPAGIRSVLESTRLAKEKNLAIRAGFNFRFESPYRAAMQRVHDGAIGDLVAIYSTRMSNRLARFDGVRKPEQTDLEWQLRNWHHFVWLSGDFILEVTAHSIDKIAWAMRDVPPARCHASGARHQGTVGDAWDQWDVTYEWDNGVMAFLKTRYQNGCHNEHRDVLIGTKGKCELGWGTAKITGATNWRYTGEKPVSHQVEHDELFAELRAGRTPNDGQRMAQSTMMGIMGRMSAYTGKEVTWDFAMQSKLATMPEKLTWDMKLPEPKPAEPGKTPLV